MSHASKVPAYSFSREYETQCREVRENPLIRRFAVSRSKLDQDPLRPRYHFMSPEAHTNDPNGFCRWKGLYHLFYQAYPPEDGRQHWGHAVSTDLIHWKDLPLAIYPDPEDCCFSGSIYVEENRVIAAYHGTEAGTMVAVSDDPLLLNWKKVTGEPVIRIPHANELLPYNVFDPCIWKKDGHYYILTAGTAPQPGSGHPRRQEFLHVSDDLEHWTYLHPFLEGDNCGVMGDDGACPYFWPLSERYLLLHYSHSAGGKYLIGDYDRERDVFRVVNGALFGGGSNWFGGLHAPSAFPNGDGSVTVIFNVNDARPYCGWDQVMSLPRKLTLGGFYRDLLLEAPAGDLDSLHGEHIGYRDIALPANTDVTLPGVEGNCVELSVEIAPDEAPMTEIRVMASAGGEEYARILFQRDRGGRDIGPDGRSAMVSALTLDTTCGSLSPDCRTQAPAVIRLPIASDEPLRLRVFLDRSIIEVFANDQKTLTQRIYPTRPDSVGILFRNHGKAGHLTRVDAWQMEAIDCTF